MSSTRTEFKDSYEVAGRKRAAPSGLSWRSLVRSPVVWLVFTTLVYFADLFLKASQKCFWYDELFTVYLCRLPSFRQTWTAVIHGADYNPPIVYLFTRASERLFGEGFIAARLPEMIGVWVFSLCLYLFVSRRAGRLAGFAAALFPFLTVVQYYAYEARPHGITLGWCGLALLCWQRAKEEGSSFLWTPAFGLGLTGAVLTHVYAMYLLVPFAAVEAYQLIKNRRLQWAMAAAIILPVFAALPVYFPLVQLYRANVTSFADPSHTLLRPFAVEVLGPVGTVVLFLFVAICAATGSSEVMPSGFIPRREILLAVFLTCLPGFGLLGAELSRGPFIFRYFLAAVAGCAILLGFASSRRKRVPEILCAVLLFLVLADFGRVVCLRLTHRDLALMEPTSIDFHFGPSPENALARNKTLLAAPAGQDILVLRDIEYFYLYQYAAPELGRRLYFATPSPKNLFLGEYERLAAATHAPLKTTTFAPFFASHRNFAVYATKNASSSECGECVQEFLDAGYRVKSAQRDVDGVLYEYSK